MATDVAQLKARTRRRFEVARLRSAMLGLALLSPVLLAVVALAPRAGWAVAWTLGATCVALFALWRGQSLARGVLPGFVCALVPLTTAHAAARIGHLCTGDGCYSLCAPLCTAGGVVAGLALVRWMRAQPDRWGAFAVGGALVVSVAATGCTCLGLGGVVGVAAGLAAGALLLGLQPTSTR
jgi:hypothetical protein